MNLSGKFKSIFVEPINSEKLSDNQSDLLNNDKLEIELGELEDQINDQYEHIFNGNSQGFEIKSEGSKQSKGRHYSMKENNNRLTIIQEIAFTNEQSASREESDSYSEMSAINENDEIKNDKSQPKFSSLSRINIIKSDTQEMIDVSKDQEAQNQQSPD